jgi:hypothetical protein
MAWQRVFPVLISIAVIILVAVLQEQSKVLAAITATMPLAAPLSLWIVYAAENGDTTSVTQFSESLLISAVPLLLFLGAAWFAARRGWGIVPIIAGGYGAWAAGLALLFGLRQVLGR